MNLKKQRGFLSILSVGIIVIASIVSSLLIGMLTGGISSEEHTYKVQAAFNLANSALQIAKRDIVTNGATCGNINGAPLYTNANLAYILGVYSGEYIMNCVQNIANATLAADLDADTIDQLTLNSYTPGISAELRTALNASETGSIHVINTNGFPSPSGVVKVDDEYISYADISGNFLQNLIRGIANTTPASHAQDQIVYSSHGMFFNSGFVMVDAEIIGYSAISADGRTLYNLTRGVGGTNLVAHSANTTVVQHQDTLTVTAGVPSLVKSEGSKTIQEQLFAQSAFLGSYQAAVIVTGTDNPNITIGGNTRIVNNNVTDDDPNFPGSTLITTGNAQFVGNARTIYKTGWSTPTANDGDIFLNSTVVSRDTLELSIFAKGIAEYISGATLVINPANFEQEIANATYDDIVVVTGDLTIDYAVHAVPKMLIVNGDLTINESGKGKSDGITIGTPEHPTTLIVYSSSYLSGNFTIPDHKGSLKVKCVITGILYVSGNVDFSDNVNQVDVDGFTAVRGNMNVEKLGNFYRTRDVLQTLQNYQNNLLAQNYSPYGHLEIFK